MADLTLDLKLLEQVKNDLDAIVKDWHDADDFSDSVADAVGHDSLHDHVRDFAHKWNEKRKEMVKNVEGVQKAFAAVTDNFTKVDADLAKSLEDSAKDKDYPKPKGAN